MAARGSYRPPKIPEMTIRRLSVYTRCLLQLEEDHVKTISSQDLAERFNLNSAQVRKDLAYFGEFGVRGIGYYVAGLALIQALNAVDGDLSDGHVGLREALSTMPLEAPFGAVTLDENRQAIVDTTVQQLVLEGDEVVAKTVALIKGVDQTFGGTFSEDTPPPGRDAPGCEARDLPWVGNAIPVVDGVPQE